MALTRVSSSLAIGKFSTSPKSNLHPSQTLSATVSQTFPCPQQSMPLQLVAIDGKLEVVGCEGEKSGWREEEGFLPLLAFLLLGVFWRRRGWRKAINLRFVISHFPSSLPRQSRPPIPHLLDGRGEEPTMERD